VRGTQGSGAACAATAPRCSASKGCVDVVPTSSPERGAMARSTAPDRYAHAADGDRCCAMIYPAAQPRPRTRYRRYARSEDQSDGEASIFTALRQRERICARAPVQSAMRQRRRTRRAPRCRSKRRKPRRSARVRDAAIMQDAIASARECAIKCGARRDAKQSDGAKTPST